MNRFYAMEAVLSERSDPENAAVLAMLQEASVAIDGLLRSALVTADAAAVDLSEASQAVHRALIALSAA
jgi:hypothetical protein